MLVETTHLIPVPKLNTICEYVQVGLLRSWLSGEKTDTNLSSDVNKTKFLRQEQDQNNKTKTKTAAYKTKTTGSKQRHFADLTFK